MPSSVGPCRLCLRMVHPVWRPPHCVDALHPRERLARHPGIRSCAPHCLARSRGGYGGSTCSLLLRRLRHRSFDRRACSLSSWRTAVAVLVGLSVKCQCRLWVTKRRTQSERISSAVPSEPEVGNHLDHFRVGREPGSRTATCASCKCGTGKGTPRWRAARMHAADGWKVVARLLLATTLSNCVTPPRPTGATIPNSARCARMELMMAICRRMNR